MDDKKVEGEEVNEIQVVNADKEVVEVQPSTVDLSPAKRLAIDPDQYEIMDDKQVEGKEVKEAVIVDEGAVEVQLSAVDLPPAKRLAIDPAQAASKPLPLPPNPNDPYGFMPLGSTTPLFVRSVDVVSYMKSSKKPSHLKAKLMLHLLENPSQTQQPQLEKHFFLLTLHCINKLSVEKLLTSPEELLGCRDLFNVIVYLFRARRAHLPPEATLRHYILQANILVFIDNLAEQLETKAFHKKLKFSKNLEIIDSCDLASDKRKYKKRDRKAHKGENVPKDKVLKLNDTMIGALAELFITLNDTLGVLQPYLDSLGSARLVQILQHLLKLTTILPSSNPAFDPLVDSMLKCCTIPAKELAHQVQWTNGYKRDYETVLSRHFTLIMTVSYQHQGHPVLISLWDYLSVGLFRSDHVKDYEEVLLQKNRYSKRAMFFDKVDRLPRHLMLFNISQLVSKFHEFYPEGHQAGFSLIMIFIKLLLAPPTDDDAKNQNNDPEIGSRLLGFNEDENQTNGLEAPQKTKVVLDCDTLDSLSQLLGMLRDYDYYTPSNTPDSKKQLDRLITLRFKLMRLDQPHTVWAPSMLRVFQNLITIDYALLNRNIWERIRLTLKDFDPTTQIDELEASAHLVKQIVVEHSKARRYDECVEELLEFLGADYLIVRSLQFAHGFSDALSQLNSTAQITLIMKTIVKHIQKTINDTTCSSPVGAISMLAIFLAKVPTSHFDQITIIPEFRRLMDLVLLRVFPLAKNSMAAVPSHAGDTHNSAFDETWTPLDSLTHQLTNPMKDFIGSFNSTKKAGADPQLITSCLHLICNLVELVPEDCIRYLSQALRYLALHSLPQSTQINLSWELMLVRLTFLAFDNLSYPTLTDPGNEEVGVPLIHTLLSLPFSLISGSMLTQCVESAMHQMIQGPWFSKLVHGILVVKQPTTTKNQESKHMRLIDQLMGYLHVQHSPLTDQALIYEQPHIRHILVNEVCDRVLMQILVVYSPANQRYNDSGSFNKKKKSKPTSVKTEAKRIHLTELAINGATHFNQSIQLSQVHEELVLLMRFPRSNLLEAERDIIKYTIRAHQLYLQFIGFHSTPSPLGWFISLSLTRHMFSSAELNENNFGLSLLQLVQPLIDHPIDSDGYQKNLQLKLQELLRKMMVSGGSITSSSRKLLLESADGIDRFSWLKNTEDKELNAFQRSLLLEVLVSEPDLLVGWVVNRGRWTRAGIQSKTLSELTLNQIEYLKQDISEPNLPFTVRAKAKLSYELFQHLLSGVALEVHHSSAVDCTAYDLDSELTQLINLGFAQSNGTQWVWSIKLLQLIPLKIRHLDTVHLVMPMVANLLVGCNRYSLADFPTSRHRLTAWNALLETTSFLLSNLTHQQALYLVRLVHRELLSLPDPIDQELSYSKYLTFIKLIISTPTTNPNYHLVLRLTPHWINPLCQFLIQMNTHINRLKYHLMIYNLLSQLITSTSQKGVFLSIQNLGQLISTLYHVLPSPKDNKEDIITPQLTMMVQLLLTNLMRLQYQQLVSSPYSLMPQLTQLLLKAADVHCDMAPILQPLAKVSCKSQMLDHHLNLLLRGLVCRYDPSWLPPSFPAVSQGFDLFSWPDLADYQLKATGLQPEHLPGSPQLLAWYMLFSSYSDPRGPEPLLAWLSPHDQSLVRNAYADFTTNFKYSGRA